MKTDSAAETDSDTDCDSGSDPETETGVDAGTDTDADADEESCETCGLSFKTPPWLRPAATNRHLPVCSWLAGVP